MRDLVMSLVSSVVAGTAVWLGQRLLRYRRLARQRAFFGVSPDAGCQLVSPRHFSSPHPASVHRNDMAALVALATVVNDCGARAEVITEATGLQGVGRGRPPPRTRSSSWPASEPRPTWPPLGCWPTSTGGCCAVTAGGAGGAAGA